MKSVLKLLWAAAIALVVFSILYKADFIFGDEYHLIDSVCRGIPVHMGEGIRASGRFYPFQFWDINFVLLIPGLTPDHYALAFYIRNAVFFVMTMVLVFLIVSCLAREIGVNGVRGDLMVFFISLSALVIPDFLRIYWHNIFAESRLALLFVIFAWCVVKARTGKKGWIIGAIVSAVLSIGYKETSFILCVVFPLTMLVFKWRGRNDDEWRSYCRMCYVLLAVGVAYIIFYFGYWARGIAHSYNDGRTVPLLDSVKFYMSIPLVVISFALGILRGARVLFFNDRESLAWDALLFSSLAIVCAYAAMGLVIKYYVVPAQCIFVLVVAYWLFRLFRYKCYVGIAVPLLCLVLGVLSWDNVVVRWRAIFGQRCNDMSFVRELAKDKSISRIYYCASEGKQEGPLKGIQGVEMYYKHVFKSFFRHAGGDLKICHDGAGLNGSLSTNEVAVYFVHNRSWRSRGNQFKKLGAKVLKSSWFEAIYGPVRAPSSVTSDGDTVFLEHFSDEDCFLSFYADGDEGRWGNGDSHVIVHLPTALRGRKLDARLDVGALCGGDRPLNALTVSVFGEEVFSSKIRWNGLLYFTVPESLTNVEKIDFRLQTSYVVNPKREGISSDARDLGVYFRSLRLTCAEETK